MRYHNESVIKAKKMMVSRLSYLVGLRLDKMTGRELAESIGMSNHIISKLRNNISHGISFEAVTEAAERLQLRFKLVIEFDGKRNNVEVVMESLESSKVRTLGGGRRKFIGDESKRTY